MAKKFLSQPDFVVEQNLMSHGCATVCGVDEAGRGPLAGPVMAAAVILDPGQIPAGLNDSKKLNEQKRSILFHAIVETSIVSAAHVSAATIDRINIRQASLEAMRLAVEGLERRPQHALIDGNVVPQNMPCDATALVKGDGRSLSIAAASIVAKVMRDRLMTKAAIHYPGYDLNKHKGYPTKAHRDILMEKGPCPLHRQTFGPVALSLKA